MLKCALIFNLLIIGLAFSANETEKYVLVEKIFTHAGVGDFASMAGQVKAGEKVNPANSFAPENELSQEEELFWKSFPLNEYLSGFKKQMMNLFSLKDMQEIERFYRNPFYAKILIHLNSKAGLSGFWEKLPLLEEELDEVKMSKNKVVLIQSLVNLHKINALIVDQKRQLQNEIERQSKVLEILKFADETSVQMDKERNEGYLRVFDLLAVKFFGKSFQNFRESELREMVRVMDSKKIKDFGQLATSYHYHFLENYKQNFRKRQKAKKALERKEEFIR